MDDDFVYVSSAYCPESERLGKKIFGFLIDFPAWTLIGLVIIAFLPRDIEFSSNLAKGLYGLWGLSFLGLYWTRHVYVLLWKMIKFTFRKIF
ncbi:MAG: hypothetical protein II847_07240 [Ruminobacter sp.]|uniref:Uncharacterized protein n=1 Tax=Ruminobacter amylophilus TaxID=867 RepID=A0A662ZK77_9GAMM|nr:MULTISPECIES: hypothetical protein [Ruminobacter]MBQ3775905.1 hypothetical protein [Ruminobacter sp.]SFP77256.1 hypothetical protein SAMN02910344_02271 [Ruminobacter amylophilus]